MTTPLEHNQLLRYHNRMQLSIVIPVYNEDENIKATLDELLALDHRVEREIIVVDDGSTDQTPQILKGYADRARILRHHMNRGYGAALKTGIRQAKGEYILMFDGDGQFDPKHIPHLYRTITEGPYDLVAGERASKKDGSPVSRLPFKAGLKLLIYILFGKWIRDLNCGYRIYRKSAIEKYLHICSDKFSFSTTSLLVLLNRGYAVVFIPMEARPRGGNRSGVMRAGTISNILYLMLRTAVLFNPLRIFLPVGALALTFGIIWGMRFIAMGHGLSPLGLLFIFFGLLLFFFGLVVDQIAEMRKERFE